MNRVTVFKNEMFGTMRTTVIGGDVYFVGKDIAGILGYKNTRDAIIKHVDRRDKRVAKCDTPGGAQEMVVITESGLYSLILSSKNPYAKEIRYWVTSEIMPKVLKDGMYITDELLDNPDFAIRTFTRLKEEREKWKQEQRLREIAENTVARQQLLIEKMAEDVEFCNRVLKSKDTVLVTVIAKLYGMSGRAFNKLLHDYKIQYKIGGTWVLYQEYCGNGYTKDETYLVNGNRTDIRMKWTQKGVKFLYNFLKGKGILPENVGDAA